MHKIQVTSVISTVGLDIFYAGRYVIIDRFSIWFYWGNYVAFMLIVRLLVTIV